MGLGEGKSLDLNESEVQGRHRQVQVYLKYITNTKARSWQKGIRKFILFIIKNSGLVSAKSLNKINKTQLLLPKSYS